MCSKNPIDIIWKDQPQAPAAPIELHPIGFAGELAKDKLARLATAIGKDGATHAVLTDPSSIAWAFNIRGGDVPHTPLALGFAILAADGSHQLFMDKRKFSRQVAAYLTQLAALHEPGEFEAAIVALAKGGAKIALDPVLAADKLRMLIEDNGGTVIAAPDPARIPRATKNQARSTARAAHRRDGAAWQAVVLAGAANPAARRDRSRHQAGGDAPADRRGNEMLLRRFLRHHFRRRPERRHHALPRPRHQPQAAGWRAVPARFRRAVSGRHHRHHRTVPIGQPTEDARTLHAGAERHDRHFQLRFPAGTRGSEIDAVARMALWKHGCDFAHGTGQRAGSIWPCMRAAAHRPHRHRKAARGMMLSNEPGYYKKVPTASASRT